MRIGVDARELCGHATGAGRYLGGLLREWAAEGHAAQRHEFILYAPERPGVDFDPRRFAVRLVPGKPGAWWEQVRLPQSAQADRLDVFFAPAYSAPLGLRVPTVVAIHDVSFFAHPEWFRTREGLRRRWLTRRSAGRARAVVTISNFSRGEILDALGLPEARVHVIPPGVTRIAAGQENGRDERILFVGSIFNRRHVPDLVRSFAALARRRPAASLDLVGDNRTYPHEDLPAAIEAAQLTGRIRWHRYAAEDQLTDLYARARAFAFLSEYEGLGLTPLEALSAGVPPVLLDTPVARESCGEAALYVSRGDVEGTARALEAALVDPPTRTRLLAAASDTLARYDWPRAAVETLSLIESIGS